MFHTFTTSSHELYSYNFFFVSTNHKTTHIKHDVGLMLRWHKNFGYHQQSLIFELQKNKVQVWDLICSPIIGLFCLLMLKENPLFKYLFDCSATWFSRILLDVGCHLDFSEPWHLFCSDDVDGSFTFYMFEEFNCSLVIMLTEKSIRITIFIENIFMSEE